jgi:hypothetical protein
MPYKNMYHSKSPRISAASPLYKLSARKAP